MNREHFSGLWKIITGTALEACGALCGRAGQRQQGFERRITGQAQMAIGDAQRLLDACRRPDLDCDNGTHSAPPALRDMPLRGDPEDGVHLAGSL
ncbi:MAG: hypothetical protein ACTHKB_06025 [Burkholderiaceae bacterium]